MKCRFTENISVGWISFPFVDLVRTRDFPHARDWRVRSTSLSSSVMLAGKKGFDTQICCPFDERVGEIVSRVEKEENDPLKQTHIQFLFPLPSEQSQVLYTFGKSALRMQ